MLSHFNSRPSRPGFLKSQHEHHQLPNRLLLEVFLFMSCYQHPCIWTVKKKKDDDVSIMSLSLYVLNPFTARMVVPASTVLLSQCFLLSLTSAL